MVSAFLFNAGWNDMKGFYFEKIKPEEMNGNLRGSFVLNFEFKKIKN